MSLSEFDEEMHFQSCMDFNCARCNAFAKTMTSHNDDQDVDVDSEHD